jgi:hypothetical protein
MSVLTKGFGAMLVTMTTKQVEALIEERIRQYRPRPRR